MEIAGKVWHLPLLEQLFGHPVVISVVLAATSQRSSSKMPADLCAVVVGMDFQSHVVRMFDNPAFFELIISNSRIFFVGMRSEINCLPVFLWNIFRKNSKLTQNIKI
jgi:hypothetical protein